jgi:hypothetical protein
MALAAKTIPASRHFGVSVISCVESHLHENIEIYTEYIQQDEYNT